MQYQVVYGYNRGLYSTLAELKEAVEKLCKDGWKPQGGVSIAVKDGSGWIYAGQAMVKEK